MVWGKDDGNRFSSEEYDRREVMLERIEGSLGIDAWHELNTSCLDRIIELLDRASNSSSKSYAQRRPSHLDCPVEQTVSLKVGDRVQWGNVHTPYPGVRKGIVISTTATTLDGYPVEVETDEGELAVFPLNSVWLEKTEDRKS